MDIINSGKLRVKVMNELLYELFIANWWDCEKDVVKKFFLKYCEKCPICKINIKINWNQDKTTILRDIFILYTSS